MANSNEDIRLYGRTKYSQFSLTIVTIIAGSLPLAALIIVLIVINASIYLIGLITFVLGGINLLIVTNVRRRKDYQFKVIHTLIDGIANGDYSYRGMARGKDGEFFNLVKAINEMSSSLQAQRVTAEENARLLEKVVDYIDVAIVAFDQSNLIHMANPQAVKLLGVQGKDALDRISGDFTFARNIKAGETHVVHARFGNTPGQYRLHKESFISEGEAHNLLFITDVSNILRLEERKAWKNLMRVLSHEVNNSVTPLVSFSDTLMQQIKCKRIESSLKTELTDGLSVIRNRAKSMADFVSRHKDIFVVPEPCLAYCDFEALVKSVVQLFSDYNIETSGDPVSVKLDSGLFEQALINFVKNGIESSQERLGEQFEEEIKHKPCVSISWRISKALFIIKVVDNGHGIGNSENIFTPFYTTKSEGSGVGLTISKQIIESHNGHLDLQNRPKGHGSILTVTLPFTSCKPNTM